MKKSYYISFLALLAQAHPAMAHPSEVVHIHPHGQNAYLTTWIVAAAIAVGFGARFCLKRFRQI